MLMALPALPQVYTPISVTGYNADGIAEDSPAIHHTTTALDGTYIVYSAHYGMLYGGTGLPNSGSISSGSRNYQLQPYTAQNVLYLPTDATDTLTLSSPAAFFSISFLAFSTDGDGTIDVTLLFTDGSSTFHKNVMLADWFYHSGAVISGFDRADRGSGAIDGQASQPNMYPIDIPMCRDQGRVLKQIVVTNAGNPQACIFAVSGMAPATFTVSNTEPHCHGAHDGQAAITTANGAASYTYAWNTSPIQTSATATGLSAGIYDISVTGGDGCSFIYPDTLREPTGTVLSVTASATDVCAGTEVILSTSGAVSYSWTAGGSTGPADTIIAAAGTLYTVTGDLGNGCTAVGTAPLVVNNCTGIEQSSTTSLSVYPDPCDGSFSIGVEAAIPDMTITVTDMEGRSVYSDWLTDIPSGYAIPIHLDSAATGIYVLHLSAAGQQMTRRIAVVR